MSEKPLRRAWVAPAKTVIHVPELTDAMRERAAAGGPLVTVDECRFETVPEVDVAMPSTDELDAMILRLLIGDHVPDPECPDHDS